MSQTFAGVTTLPYAGSYYAKPVPAYPGELILPGNKAKQTVPINIDWQPYWIIASQPNSIGVQFSLDDQTQAGGVIDKIRSIKIDNTFSALPIYISFPDTGDIITCPPQSVITQTVISDSLKFVVYVAGLTLGFIPQTRIQLMNFCVTPSFDPAVQLVFPQWSGSPSQQRTNLLTPGYGPPALGDQAWFGSVGFNAALALPLFDTPRPSGIITICGMSIRSHPQNQNASSIAIAFNGNLYGQVYAWNQVYSTSAGQGTWESSTVFNRSGMNLRLPATDNYFLNSVATNAMIGFVSIDVEYSYQP